MSLNVADVMSGNDVSVAFGSLTPEEQSALCHGVCKELLAQCENGNLNNISAVGKFLQGVDVELVKESVKTEIKIVNLMKHNIDLNPEFAVVVDRVRGSGPGTISSDSTESI